MDNVFVTRAPQTHSCELFFAGTGTMRLPCSTGYGYLMGGMDQRNFFDLLNHIKDKVGYDGPVIVCRDHGGPWAERRRDQ